MLVNKIPVLDKGYVALVGSTLPHLAYKDLVDEHFQSKDHPSLRKICHAAIVIKAPIFVQLHLGQHGLSLVSARGSDQFEAYTPNPGEIRGSDHATNKLIADDIARTTDALLINPSAYKADGCDAFIAQTIMPVSTYTTFIVAGTLEQWQKFYQFKSVPAAIKSYADAVEQIIKAEWKDV